MLHEIKGRNRWCGPGAVSAITGRTTDEVAEVIRSVTGRRRVKGTRLWQLEAALIEFGFRTEVLANWKVGKGPTLENWLRKPREKDTIYLIRTTSHWVVVCGIEIIDNLNGGKPVLFPWFNGRRKKIKRVVKVIQQVV